MRNVIISLILLTSNYVISQKSENHNNKDSLGINRVLKKIDSLKYSEMDFNKMKKHYSESTELNKFIYKKASDRDKNAVEFLELMNLSYNKAIEKAGGNKIKGMIYVYYQTVRIKKNLIN